MRKSMFSAAFGRNALVIAAAVMAALITVAGYQPATKKVSADWSFERGMTTLGDLFGGAASFGTTLLLMIIGVIVVFGLRWLASDPEVDNLWVGVAGLAAAVAAAFAGTRWVHLPTVAGWLLLGLVAIVGVATVLVTPRVATSRPVLRPDTQTTEPDTYRMSRPQRG